MAGRFVYWMNVSLDLRIEADAGEDGGGDWMRIGESLHREFNARAEALTLMVQGRRVYEIMDPFWPDARDDASLPGFMREYGEIWTSVDATIRPSGAAITAPSSPGPSKVAGPVSSRATIRAMSPNSPVSAMLTCGPFVPGGVPLPDGFVR